MKHTEIIEKNLNKLYKSAKISDFFKEIPVSAMVFSLKDNTKCYIANNNRQKTHNVCGHAEINAIIKAEKSIKDWRLNEYAVFSFLKPCEMCSKIIETVRIKEIYYIIDQPKINENPKLKYHKIYFPGNKYIEKYDKLFTSFFKKIR